MKKMTMTLFARTPVHVGAGNSVGAVDAPVQRERHTKIPIIPGSSLKGVLSDLWNERGEDGKLRRSAEGKKLFGEDDNNADAKAGSLLIGEARVLAFPVRSAKGMFAWISCPLVLKRFARDAEVKLEFDEINISEKSCLSGKSVFYDNNQVVLEEYVLERKGDASGVAAKLKEYMPENDLWQSIDDHLVVLSDTLFSYFVENACEVVTRIRVNDQTGTVDKGGLFNQEQVPSETMFYSVLAEQKVGNSSINALAALQKRLGEIGNVLQVGGDETIGLGFCDVEVK